jgi:hypothetical protein
MKIKIYLLEKQSNKIKNKTMTSYKNIANITKFLFN